MDSNFETLLPSHLNKRLDREMEQEAQFQKHKKKHGKHVHSRTPIGVDLDYGVLHLALAIARGNLDATENLLNQGSASNIQQTSELLKVKGLKASGAKGLVYDSSGRLIAEKLTNGTAVHFRYDAQGRLLLAIFPDGDALHFHYDFMGGIEKVDPHVRGNRRALFSELAEKFRASINHLTHLTGVDGGVAPLRKTQNADEQLGPDHTGEVDRSGTSIERKETLEGDLNISVRLSHSIAPALETASKQGLEVCFNQESDGANLIREIRSIQNKKKDGIRDHLATLRSRLRTLEDNENPNATADSHDRLHSEVVTIQEESIQITKSVEELFYLDPELPCATCATCVLEEKGVLKTKKCPKNSLCQVCYKNMPDVLRVGSQAGCPVCLKPPCKSVPPT